MDNYNKELYIKDMEFIYNNILNPKSAKDINRLEDALKRAVDYKDSFERDKDNFAFHLQNIENIRKEFKESINHKILECKAAIEIQRNRMKVLEAKLIN